MVSSKEEEIIELDAARATPTPTPDPNPSPNPNPKQVTLGEGLEGKMSLPVGGVEGNDDVQSVRLLLDY